MISIVSTIITLSDLVSGVSGGDGAEHEPLGESEEAEEDEVVGSLPTDTLAAGQSDERHDHDDQCQDPEPRVFCAEPVSICRLTSSGSVNL